MSAQQPDDPGRRIAATMAKASVVWLRCAPGAAPVPAWQSWTGDASVLVHGGQEQHVDGLDTATEVDVIVRGAGGGRALTWRGAVEVLSADSADWAAAVEVLSPLRRNEIDPASQGEVWATDSAVVRLSPTGDILPAEASAHLATPRPTPATTVGPPPFVLGGRARRRPGL